jgi:hypothetical protein
VHEFDWKIYNYSTLVFCAKTVVQYGLSRINAVRFCFENRAQKMAAVVRPPYNCTDELMRPPCLVFRAAVYAETEQYALLFQIRTVRIYSSAGCLDNRALSLSWKSCPFFCCKPSFRNWKLFSYSCSLSISQILMERMNSFLVFFLL